VRAADESAPRGIATVAALWVFTAPITAFAGEGARILIADQFNNGVIEVTPDKHVAHVGSGGGKTSGVAFASRLGNGDTLITDSNNNRIVEGNSADKVVWQYATNTLLVSNAMPLPTRSVRPRSHVRIVAVSRA
jgi:hypothetical protein